jgi:hypothetical protein
LTTSRRDNRPDAAPAINESIPGNSCFMTPSSMSTRHVALRRADR